MARAERDEANAALAALRSERDEMQSEAEATRTALQAERDELKAALAALQAAHDTTRAELKASRAEAAPREHATNPATEHARDGVHGECDASRTKLRLKLHQALTERMRGAAASCAAKCSTAPRRAARRRRCLSIAAAGDEDLLVLAA